MLIAASGRISARGPVDSFPQPEVRRSVSGALQTTLRAAIHQNPMLVTHVNGQRLDPPQWFDTILVPAAEPRPVPPSPTVPGMISNINTATFGSLTFRTYVAPVTEGSFVMHCHMVQHEDVGMMQRLDLLPRPSTADTLTPRGRGGGHAGESHRLRAHR